MDGSTDDCIEATVSEAGATVRNTLDVHDYEFYASV